MTSEGGKAMTDNGTVSTETPFDAARTRDAGRVVLRGVQVIVLDDLSDADRHVALGIATAREAWIPVAAEGGSYGESINRAANGNPGKYRSVKRAAWYEQAPRHVESPLP
jgi:hypothetical protein